MKILELYKAIAESLDIVVEDDLFFTFNGESLDPLNHKAGGVSRQLVLPTYERIKAGFKDELHPFHPLCESVIEGQSPTIKFLQKAMRRALHLKGLMLVEEVLKVACGKKKPRSAVYANLIAQVTEGLKNPKMDETLFKSWEKLRNDIIADEMKIPQIFLDANKEIDGKKFSRVCYYTHKFIDEAEDGSQIFFKTKLHRKADKTILLRLCNEIFGFFPSETGSNDERPYFASLMRAWREFVIKFNKVAHSLHEVVKVDKLNDEWVSEIDDLEKYEDKIQTLALNSGDVSSKPREEKKTVSVSEMRKPEVAQPAMASMKETPHKEPGKLSVSELAQLRNGGTLGASNWKDQPAMSAAERRARESNKGAVDLFSQNQSTSLFGQSEPQSMFSGQSSSLFSNNSGGSMFSSNNNNSMGLFGNGNNGQPRSMFDTGNSSMFNR